MDDDENLTLTWRWYRTWQALGFYGVMLLIWSSWYLPAASLVILPGLSAIVLCLTGTHFKLVYLRCGGFLDFVGRALAGSFFQYWYLVFLLAFGAGLSEVVGFGSSVRWDLVQLMPFFVGVAFGLVPLPRRASASLLVLGAIAPLATGPLAACGMHSSRLADPQPLNYAAYFLFLAGSVRLVIHAASRYLSEGLDPVFAAAEPKFVPRRAVGPLADVALIGLPRTSRPQPARASRGSPLKLKLEGARCPVCASDLTGAVVTCTSCATPHHADCFSFSAVCATYACGSSAAVALS